MIDIFFLSIGLTSLLVILAVMMIFMNGEEHRPMRPWIFPRKIEENKEPAFMRKDDNPDNNAE